MKDMHASFNGVIDEAARFVEKIQLLDKPLWEKVIAVFKDGKYEMGWHGEYWGKLMRGGCMVYKYTRSEELYDTLTSAVKALLLNQDGEGRISTYAKGFEFSSWDVWCRKYVMYGLIYYMDICRDEKFKKEILTALIKHADYIVAKIGKEDGKKSITETSNFWRGANSSSILRPFVMLYKLTSDKRYLDFAEYIISEGGILGANLIDIASEDILAPYQYPIVKAYEVTSFFEGVFEYATLMNNQKLIDTCIKYGNKILKTDLTLIGASGCYDELFDNSTKKQVTYTESHMQETCVTVTLMEYFCRLLSYTGDARYADAIECSFYNAFLGAINRNFGSNDGLHFDSYSPILNNRRGLLVGGKQEFPDGSYYGCCAAIGAAGFGAITSMAARLESNSLKLNFYENGTLTFGESTVSVKTDYPFDSSVSICVTECNGAFGISLRIPAWCQKYAVTLNGKEARGSFDKGYFTLCDTLKAGDTVDLVLDMSERIYSSEEFDSEVKNLFAVARGPIVFATADYDNSSAIKEFTSYEYEGGLATLKALTELGNTVTLKSYSACGMDWKENISVWLKNLST